MDEKFCQSCGMPMNTPDAECGTNADGSKNEDYCNYCFESGKFTTDCTMDEMIEVCVSHIVTAAGMSEDAARGMMREFLPTLKRWR